MDDDELKGKARNVKGRVKEAFGAITGDKETEAKGAVERIGGAAQEKIGEAKRRLHKEENVEDDEDEDLDSE